MKRSKVIPLALAAAWLVLGSCAAAAEERSANPTSMSFAAGGTIRMKLHEGTMEVVGVPEDRITVSWHSKSSKDEREVNVKLQRSGAKEATLEVDGPGERVRYRIEVPGQSNISIDMNAGELGVSGIRGNLDAEMLAGEMVLRVAEASRYRSVRAAVLAGEITARPWQIDLNGVARSFKVTGDGDYELQAQLLAGQITIRPE